MSTGYAILISLGICGIAATLEGVCAGKNVKAYFATLRFPPHSAPLWFWYIIGGLYCAVFGDLNDKRTSRWRHRERGNRRRTKLKMMRIGFPPTSFVRLAYRPVLVLISR